MELFKLITMGILTYYALSLFIVAVKILFADSSNYERNRIRLKNISATIFGDATKHSRDGIMSCGMAADTTGLIVRRSRLTDEAIDSIRPY